MSLASSLVFWFDFTENWVVNLSSQKCLVTKTNHILMTQLCVDITDFCRLLFLCGEENFLCLANNSKECN